MKRNTKIKIQQKDLIKYGFEDYPENYFDGLVSDPPYFLINKTGKGFMGKEWDSISTNITEDNIKEYLWRYEENARYVVDFLQLLQIESNMVEEGHVLKNVNISYEKHTTKKSNSSVSYAERKFGDQNLKSSQNTSFVQGIVLTGEEVWDMLKEMLPDHIISNVKNKNIENVKYVVPISLLEKISKNTVQENVLKSLISKECEMKIIQVTSTVEAKIRGAIEGKTGIQLEKKSMNVIDGFVKYVEKNVVKEKFNVITLYHIKNYQIMEKIILLLCVYLVMENMKENHIHFSMEDFHRKWLEKVYRVMKPGAHLLVFGGTRTFHRLAVAIEDAGFEIRDTMMWLYGSGMPKGRNLYKTDMVKSIEEQLKEKTGLENIEWK